MLWSRELRRERAETGVTAVEASDVYVKERDVAGSKVMEMGAGQFSVEA
jgi:hypothetical protein